MGLADRVLVMRQGRIAGEVAGDAITEENIVRLAMGVAGGAGGAGSTRQDETRKEPA